MGSRTQPNKTLQDIEDCVSELKREFLTEKTPINDDCAVLHGFEEKLEFILLFGLIEKPGFLGPRKSYWNYICACFASSKRKHDGINFVKSVASLKTSLGRGRAFLRFCLTQKCLADTLQVCFTNKKVSRDFYSEKSLSVQESLWSALVTSLYELSDLNFDLNSGYSELDISWPKFARKVFTLSETVNLSHRNMSSSSLQSFSSQDECNAISDLNLSSASGTFISSDSTKETSDACELREQNEKLCLQNKCLQNKVTELEGEKSKLESDFQDLLMKYEYLQKQCSVTDIEPIALDNQIDLEQKSRNAFSNLTASEQDEVTSSLVPELKKMALKENEELNGENPISSQDSLLKPDIDKNLVENSSNCALKSNHAQDSSQLRNDVDSFKSSNVYFPQNHMYMTELLQEIKTVIDDMEDMIQKSNVTSALPHITRLKRMRNCLEEKVTSEIDKSRNSLNFSHFVENCVSCIQNFLKKQETAINSLQENSNISVNKNQNLYSRITVLKNLLRSYGFLKILNEKESDGESNNTSKFDTAAASASSESWDECTHNLAHDPLLKRIIVPLLPAINTSLGNLNIAKQKLKELDYGLDSVVELINVLITRVQDQGIHLKGVTKELEEAQHLVSVLKEQHTKLQSAEGILKYDLQEKRKLLSRLKQQLENTREDFNLVRLKNSKSEAEWQDLRKEFVQRHKQTSEESGFSDDRENTPSNSSCASNHSEESIHEKNSPSESPEIPDQNSPPKKSRLELLEEQCQSLYSSLLQSSKRRLEIDRRLENACKSAEKTINRTTHCNSHIINHPAEKANEDLHHTSTDTCENDIDNCASSLLSSSDIGSSNSESSYIPVPCMGNSLPENYFCESAKAELFSLQESENNSQCLTSTEQTDASNLIPEIESSSGCIAKYRPVEAATGSSSEYAELIESDNENSLHALSHVDSLLIKKKDLEESLRNLAEENAIVSDTTKCLETEAYEKQISSLEAERNSFLNKIRELEQRIIITSTELDQTKQQLLLSKVAKEHEVAALQFQLNTEVLKYEKALKEFSEQSKGLENMKEKVTDQEQLIFALEEALTEIRTDRENEKEQQWQESLYDVDEERNRNEILVSQLEELKMYSEKEKECLKSELAFLQSYSQELQRKLVKLLKEKDILWKRSNHLYHLQKDKIDDRWMKDSEVSTCLGCKSTFSFMLRKHHCRLCGRIFCYMCSNNWLLTASSSKKIRSCNECFMQYIELKKTVRRGSDVPQVDDDSADEAFNPDLSFMRKTCCSFTSGVPSSINDSILSLPITHKQNAPRFASAPDLRYVSKTDESSLCSKSSVVENCLEEREEKLLGENDSINQDDNLNEGNNFDVCESEVHQQISRINKLKEITVSEMKETGHDSNGKFVVCSGEKVEFPVFCDVCPIIIKWCFATNNQDIPVIVEYKNDEQCDKSFQEKHNLQDEMLLSLSGYYVFSFDNSNRAIDVKIEYTFSLKDADY